MTDAQQALAQVREALAACKRYGRAGVPVQADALAAILAHVEAQEAEIERLTKACRHAVIALAAATDQMPVFAADYAAVSDALKEQR